MCQYTGCKCVVCFHCLLTHRELFPAAETWWRWTLRLTSGWSLLWRSGRSETTNTFLLFTASEPTVEIWIHNYISLEFLLGFVSSQQQLSGRIEWKTFSRLGWNPPLEIILVRAAPRRLSVWLRSEKLKFQTNFSIKRTFSFTMIYFTWKSWSIYWRITGLESLMNKILWEKRLERAETHLSVQRPTTGVKWLSFIHILCGLGGVWSLIYIYSKW